MAPGTRGSSLRALVAAAILLAGCTGAQTARSSRPGGHTPGPVVGSRRAPSASAPRVEVSAAGFRLAAPVEREVAVAEGGTVYLAGGLDAGGTSATGVFALDPTSGALTTLGTLPQAFHDAAGAILRGRLFVFGGGTSASSDAVQAFDLSNDRGAVVGHLPRATSDLSAVELGDTVYLVGGWDGHRYGRDLLATGDGRRFRPVARLPTGLRYPAVAAAQGAVVIAGGRSPHGTTDAIYRFDPATGDVSRIASLPHPVSDAAAFAAQGVVYVAGGLDAGGWPVGTVTAVDPGTGRTWSAGTLLRPISDAAVASDGEGTAWLLGGERGHPLAEVTVLGVGGSAPGTLPTTAPPAPTPLDGRGVTGSATSAAASVRPFSGLLLIADRGNDRLLVVNPRGHVVWRYPDPSLPPPSVPFYFPDDAFWVHGGHAILVNEEENDVLTEIAYPSGRTLWTYGHPRVPGSGDGYVHQPDDLYPYPRGGVVVADAMNCRILFFDRRGDPGRQIGQTGNCTPGLPRTVGYPNGDTPLPNGHLLITELHGGSISEIRPNGHALWTVHIPALDVPSDPQRLDDGTYVAANYARPGAVVRFRSDGRVVWMHHPAGGPRMLDHPSLAVPLPNGLIAVTDDYRDRVVLIDPRTGRIVWQYGHTDASGRADGYLHIPDGLDLLLPGGITPLHVDFASTRTHLGRP